jgi:hypothetical protein
MINRSTTTGLDLERTLERTPALWGKGFALAAVSPSFGRCRSLPARPGDPPPRLAPPPPRPRAPAGPHRGPVVAASNHNRETIMPTYTATFFTAADCASRPIEAATAQQALEFARKAYDEHFSELEFRNHDSIEPLEQIEICNNENFADGAYL